MATLSNATLMYIDAHMAGLFSSFTAVCLIRTSKYELTVKDIPSNINQISYGNSFD